MDNKHSKSQYEWFSCRLYVICIFLGDDLDISILLLRMIGIGTFCIISWWVLALILYMMLVGDFSWDLVDCEWFCEEMRMRALKFVYLVFLEISFRVMGTLKEVMFMDIKYKVKRSYLLKLVKFYLRNKLLLVIYKEKWFIVMAWLT